MRIELLRRRMKPKHRTFKIVCRGCGRRSRIQLPPKIKPGRWTKCPKCESSKTHNASQI